MLNEMHQVKANLMATNKFKPNLSSFNQKEETSSLFGLIKLSGYSKVNSFKGQILTNLKQCLDLIM
jgi:hypothetical protein